MQRNDIIFWHDGKVSYLTGITGRILAVERKFLDCIVVIFLFTSDMPPDLEDEYPEAAPYILNAVEEHSEDWVIENYFPKIAQLGTVMNIPSIEELPFYDEEKHDVSSEKERVLRPVQVSQ
jgi:hypothetical protein